MTKITLGTPIRVGGEDTRELTLREPRVGDLKGVRLSISEEGLGFETDALILVAARLAGVPASALEDLPVREIVAIAGQVGPLLSGAFPATGKTPPET